MLKKLLNSVSVVLILALVFSTFACAPLSVSAAETVPSLISGQITTRLKHRLQRMICSAS